MKAHVVLLAFALTSGNSLRAAADLQDLALTEMTLRMAFVSPDGKGGYTNVSVMFSNASHVSLTFSNASSRTGSFRLPSGFYEHEYPPSFPRPPWLGLLVTELKSAAQEEIVFATFTNTPGPGTTVPLAPGGTHRIVQPISCFYFCGMEGPSVNGSLWTILTPGDVELSVQAVVFDKDKEGRLISNVETMRRSFPGVLFRKRKIELDPRTETDRKPATDSK